MQRDVMETKHKKKQAHTTQNYKPTETERRDKYNLESATSPIINTHKHVRSLKDQL